MSFLIGYRIDNGMLKQVLNYRKRVAPSPTYVSSDGEKMLAGYTFDISPDKLLNAGWEANPKMINHGSIAAALVSWSSGRCIFANSNSASEPLYYFYEPITKEFLLSDNFWEIVAELRPEFDDLDVEAIEEMVFVGSINLTFRTPVKNINWVPGNCFGAYDSHDGSFKFKQFDSYVHTCEVSNVDEAVDQMDAALTRGMKTLADKHPGCVFGVGLSGGLDSRCMLHYAEKSDIKVQCFNTAASRPRTFLKASSVCKAEKLADIAGVDLTIVEWDPKTIDLKRRRQLSREPLSTFCFPSEAYKYESIGRPQFDYLLRGGGGIGPIAVGATIPLEIDDLTRPQLVNEIYTSLAGGGINPLFSWQSDMNGAFKFMHIKKRFIDRGIEIWRQFAKESAEKRLKEKTEEYIDSCHSNGLDNFDTYFSLKAGIAGAIGMRGAYESGFASDTSYSFYAPWINECSLTWAKDLILDRKVLKALIQKKIPEFSKVSEERFGAVGVDTGKVSKIFDAANYLVRGSGIQADERYANHPAVQKSFYRDFSNQGTWFWSIFDGRASVDDIWKLSPTRKNAIWFIKSLIDCLERKEYLGEEFDWC